MKHLPSIILYLNRKYDVCSCLSQSEDLNPGVLFVKTEFMRGRAMKTFDTYWLIYIRPFLKYGYERCWCDRF